MPSKGQQTRETILRQAMLEVSVVGLDGLTIGQLAKKTGMSKSGLFGHFACKEALQLQVLEHAAQAFTSGVVVPALKEPRGVPRLRAIFDRWLGWAFHGHLPGGCIFLSASAELDDKPGPLRDSLEASQRLWLGTLSRASSLCRAEGHFSAAVDDEQIAFELYAIMMSAHLYGRLLREKDMAQVRARTAFEHLLNRAATAAH